MEQKDLERLAYIGVQPPEGIGAADTLYFLMLRALYAFGKQTEISPEQGRQEKAKIQETVRTYRADQALTRHCAEVLTKTGAARAEYRKARNNMPAASEEWSPDVSEAIRAADRLVEALDNIPVERRMNAKPNFEGQRQDEQESQ